MKVLICLCACIAVSSAGIIGYPLAPISYVHPGAVAHPFATYNPIARPYGITYGGIHGYPVAVAPSYFSYNLLPGNVFFGPELIHYLPVAPANGKGKPGKKKPDDKKNEEGKKEETTEEPKPEGEGETTNGEAENLDE